MQDTTPFLCLFLPLPLHFVEQLIKSSSYGYLPTNHVSLVQPTGLNLLYEMLVMFAKSDSATQFYQTYYLQLLREIFAVMTGEKNQLRMIMFFIVLIIIVMSITLAVWLKILLIHRRYLP